VKVELGGPVFKEQKGGRTHNFSQDTGGERALMEDWDKMADGSL